MNFQSKVKIFLIVFILLLTLIVNLKSVKAVEIGGELEIGSGLSYSDDLKAEFYGQGEFELFLPQSSIVEPRLVFQTSLADDRVNSDIKYMYIRHRKDGNHLTVGRQPVSWSYGAMINLLDYGLGIDGLADETIRPGIDGLRYHYSLGEGRNIQLVTSFSEFSRVELDELGYGGRLRLPGSGYDLSFNLAYQPLGKDNLLRTGMTYNKDIGDIGTYGSLGYFYKQDREIDDIMLQLGMDYSWIVGGDNGYGGRQLILQAEYFRFLKNNLNASIMSKLMIGGGEAEGAGSGLETVLLSNRDLLTLNLSTSLDYFSDLGLLLMIETKDCKTVLAPYYSSDLGGGLEMSIDAMVLRDSGGDFYSGISSSLSYYF